MQAEPIAAIYGRRSPEERADAYAKMLAADAAFPAFADPSDARVVETRPAADGGSATRTSVAVRMRLRD